MTRAASIARRADTSQSESVVDLSVALRHPNNRPLRLVPELIRRVGATVSLSSHLDEVGCGVIADFRPGWETIEPVLHIERHPTGRYTFRRVGGDEFFGGPTELIIAALGFSRAEACAFLINRVSDEAPQPWKPKAVEFALGRSYIVHDGRLCLQTTRVDRKTGLETTQIDTLAEFVAYVVEVVNYVDGGSPEPEVFFVLTGFDRTGRPLSPPQIQVSAKTFPLMQWPMQSWSIYATVHAGPGVRDHARAAIELFSQQRSVLTRTVYRHIGWINHAIHGPVYLSANRAIGSDGVVEDIDVSLPIKRLRYYQLPAPCTGDTLIQAIQASLRLIDLVPDRYSVPYLAMVYRAPLGHLDTILWPTGKTGRQKTTFLLIMMLHFGTAWNERELLLSWHSTANAIEMVASMARDALVLIDDFKPAADSRAMSQAYTTLSRIIRAVGDGSARNALTASRELHQTPELCAAFASSSETYPLGQSDVARTIIVHVNEKLARDEPTRLAMRNAQTVGKNGTYAEAMAGFLQFLARRHHQVYASGQHHEGHIRQHEQAFVGGHDRTAVAMAELSYGWRLMLYFAVSIGAITSQEADTYWQRVCHALHGLAVAQSVEQADEDPVHRTLGLLVSLFDQRRVSVTALSSDQQFSSNDIEQAQKGVAMALLAEIAKHGPDATFIGWIRWTSPGDAWMHLLPDALYETLQESARRQNAPLPPKKTLLVQLRDALQPRGLMRCDREKGRMRWDHSVVIDGQRRRLLTLRWPLTTAMEELGLEEKSSTQPSFPIIDWTAEI